MIPIHRSKPIVMMGRDLVMLTQDEHRLLVVLGMLDNRVAPRSILLETMCEGRAQILSDDQLLTIKICRLRKKIGHDHLKCIRNQGYTLQGQVYFIGSPEK